jgi:hypothetical protein
MGDRKNSSMVLQHPCSSVNREHLPGISDELKAENLASLVQRYHRFVVVDPPNRRRHADKLRTGTPQQTFRVPNRESCGKRGEEGSSVHAFAPL